MNLLFQNQRVTQPKPVPNSHDWNRVNFKDTLGWQGPYSAKHWIFKNDNCKTSLGPCARCWTIPWEFHQLEFLLLQHIYGFVFSVVTPEKDLGFAFSRQWEWPDTTTTFSALRHCSLTLSSRTIQCSPMTTPVYWFQSCIAGPQDTQRITDAFSKCHIEIFICWLRFHFIYSWPLLLEGCTTHSFLADHTVAASHKAAF